MKVLLLSLSLLLILNVNAQSDFKSINRDSIKAKISDSNSASYYPSLLERFNKFDTTLSLEDYRLLYYGFVFQKDYQPYGDLKGKEIRKAISEKDIELANSIADSAINKAPICLKANYNKATVLYAKDSLNDGYKKYMSRYSGILYAILSTGDGVKCETAYKVIYVSDEYDIIYNYYLIEEFLSQSLVFPCDKMNIKPNKYFTQSSMYFDTSESFLYMQEKLGDKKEDKKKNKKDN